MRIAAQRRCVSPGRSGTLAYDRGWSIGLETSGQGRTVTRAIGVRSSRPSTECCPRASFSTRGRSSTSPPRLCSPLSPTWTSTAEPPSSSRTTAANVCACLRILGSNRSCLVGTPPRPRRRTQSAKKGSKKFRFKASAARRPQNNLGRPLGQYEWQNKSSPERRSQHGQEGTRSPRQL